MSVQQPWLLLPVSAIADKTVDNIAARQCNCRWYRISAMHGEVGLAICVTVGNLQLALDVGRSCCNWIITQPAVVKAAVPYHCAALDEVTVSSC